VLFSPWLDLGVSGQDQPALEAHDPALTIEFLRRAGKLWAKEVLPGDPRVSPLYAAQQGLPPTIVFSGSRDILDSDALRLAQVNPAIKHRHYRNMVHVWPCAPIPEAGRALDEAASFIAKCLQPRRGPPC
jgi:acetyl esterase/lipase